MGRFLIFIGILLIFSFTENLIKTKEMEARLEHGWVTVEGASTVVADEK